MSINRMFLLIPLLALSAQGAAADCPLIVSGQITDTASQPVAGASVAIWQDSTCVGGTAADADGRFDLRFTLACERTYRLVVSSVGFTVQEISLPASGEPLLLAIELGAAPANLGTRTVYPKSEAASSAKRRDHATVLAQAQRSLVASNLTASITEPEVVRSGSIHSSQLRIDGAAPAYTLNGISLGDDPNHYGMFSLLPAAIAQSVDLSLGGSSAAQQQPSAVAVRSPQAYDSPGQLDLHLSSIDANAILRRGTTRWFLFGSARKSILDELVKRAEVGYDRQTVPPANFADVYVGGGIRLSPSDQLSVDWIQGKDRLSFHSGDFPGTAARTIGSQTSNDQLAAISYRRLSGDWGAQSSVSFRTGHGNYLASPGDGTIQRSDLVLDLDDRQRTVAWSFMVDRQLRSGRVSAGLSADLFNERVLRLRQQNWNFRPPFSSDDSPLVWQELISKQFDDLNVETDVREQAAFASVQGTIGRFTGEQGIRLDRFPLAARRLAVTWRSDLTWKVTRSLRGEFFAGTFATSPFTSALEANQALIRTEAANVRPIMTSELSIGLSTSQVRTRLSLSQQRDLPVLSPDFSLAPAADEAVDPGFYRVRSVGTASFATAAIELYETKLIGNHLLVSGSYAFSRARRSSDGITTVHELDSPHRLRAQLQWQPNRSFRFGLEGIMRSGLPYTERDESMPTGDYTSRAFAALRESEYNRRFPLAGYLNLSAEYRFGRGSAFATISNITNQANPVVSTSTGLIYDAGILPTLGLRLRW